MNVTVNVDVNETLSRFDPKTQKNVQRNIISKLARMAAKETKKRIIEIYNIRPKSVVIEVVNAKVSNMTAQLKGIKRPFSMLRFSPRKESDGISVEVMRGRRVLIRGGFIAQPSGKDYSKRGQKNQATRPFQLVFTRYAHKPYPILASTKELRKFNKITDDEVLSVGKYIGSEANMKAISDMINRERDNVARDIVDRWMNKRINALDLESE